MSNQAFRVQGNARLKGSIQPQGAKNEALQIISAVLQTIIQHHGYYKAR